jgi:hypothetical protein
MHTRPKVNVKSAIHVLSEFMFPPSEWSDDRTSGGQPLAHLWIHVKQIIIKSIERRKIYVMRREKKVTPEVTQIADLIRHLALNQ